MEYIARYFLILYEGLQTEFTVYGFRFSLWGIFVFVTVAGIVFGVICKIFD